MSGRNITRKQNLYTTPWNMSTADFPKDKDGVIYVRQSSLTQQQKNIHSFEMQTDKFLEHFRDMGCTGNIELIADDEALSGTLDIHKRKGLTKVVKLIEEEKIGWAAAVFVNRLTRDEWLITPAVLMKKCYEHHVWIATLRMHFNFEDEYCRRVFMMEAEESARHLKWMKSVLGGAKSVASDNGYYDGRFIVPGYIVDRSDEQRKRYVVYEPHAAVVRWLFRRFLELDGQLPLLCRELERLPYVFPAFETWVEDKTTIRFSLYRKSQNNRTPEGQYKLGRHGLISILTNPVYIGWWIPLDGGVIEDNHEPIVETALFTYAHRMLSTYDFNGERQRPARVVRHSAVDAILKKVIKAPDGINLYVHRSTRTYTYLDQQGKLVVRDAFAVSIQVIDSAFLAKFFERVRSIDPDQFRDWEDRIDQKHQAQEKHHTLIVTSIQEVTRKMQRITDLLTDTESPEPLSDSLTHDLIRQHKGLESKKRELQVELGTSDTEEPDDEETLYEIHTLIPRIVALWDELPFSHQLRFVGALVREVIVYRPAPNWVKMEIHWKLQGWETDVAHIRWGHHGEHWTPEEEERLREMYPSDDAGAILHALPSKNWRAIKAKAGKLVIGRNRNSPNSIPVNSSDYVDMSSEDVVYAEQHGLVLSTKNVQWSS